MEMNDIVTPPLDARLNRDCFCIGVDEPKLWATICAAVPEDVVDADLMEERRHLFSTRPVFMSRPDLEAMEGIVSAVEAACELPGYRDAALGDAPQIARIDLGPRGVFMGYDFHLGPDGPRLIEINTNAGGAFLNVLLGRALLACCPEVQDAIHTQSLDEFDDQVWRMFQAEWRLQGRTHSPKVVAIVDDHPNTQYLLPEFLLAKAFFERHGMAAVIVDPSELSFDGRRLRHGTTSIDLVYNRLVDFALEAPEHQVLQAAYLADACVVTPNPRNHAMLADKRNLILLSDPDRLAAMGLSSSHCEALSGVPATRSVTGENAEELWSSRKGLFFKPVTGHGGKAVYRGDKLTRTVWEAILRGGFVAQALVSPTERMIDIEGGVQPRKVDVRLYTYAGKTLLAAARLYQGQTTNFRTPGGGFAPVQIV